MFDPSDTIVAVATPPGGWRHVIRISGPNPWDCCQSLCPSPIDPCQPGVVPVQLALPPDIRLPAQLYTYRNPHSYTGEDLIEIHASASTVIVETLLEKLLTCAGVRRAGPGEFTARAYLNGKLDLAQAESVYEIIHSTNRVQLEAAQGLLRGHLGATLSKARSGLLTGLGLLEASLDFSQENIHVAENESILQQLLEIRTELEQVRQRGLHDRETIHLPSVGIAGAPNAGKSSLFNALLGRTRSLVSPTQRTTRDVLAARLHLPHGECLLFDCAGLLNGPETLLDRLAQQAALESLHRASAVLFCVDAAQPKPDQDGPLLCMVHARNRLLLGTKCDLLGDETTHRQQTLAEAFRGPCLMVSAATQHNLDTVIQTLDRMLTAESASPSTDNSLLSLSARHRNALQGAWDNLDQAVNALQEDQNEVAALLLRTAYQHLSETTQHVDEEILGEIFAHFCIGK